MSASSLPSYGNPITHAPRAAPIAISMCDFYKRAREQAGAEKEKRRERGRESERARAREGGPMCSVRSFVTDDLFNFNHVNLDLLTETVSGPRGIQR